MEASIKGYSSNCSITVSNKLQKPLVTFILQTALLVYIQRANGNEVVCSSNPVCYSINFSYCRAVRRSNCFHENQDQLNANGGESAGDSLCHVSFVLIIV